MSWKEIIAGVAITILSGGSFWFLKKFVKDNNLDKFSLNVHKMGKTAKFLCNTVRLAFFLLFLRLAMKFGKPTSQHTDRILTIMMGVFMLCIIIAVIYNTTDKRQLKK